LFWLTIIVWWKLRCFHFISIVFLYVVPCMR
jgi:hypothetical protein